MRMRRIWQIFVAGMLAAVIGAAILYWLAPSSLYRLSTHVERTLAGLESRSITVGEGENSLEWHYLEGGEGPTLLLLHGFGGDADHWTRVARFLTPHFTVIAPDLPGFGQTGRPVDGQYTIPAQAVRVLAFMDTLGLERTDIGGSSMGGYLAGGMSSLSSDRLRSLWLLAPGGVEGAPPSDMFRAIAEGSNPLIPDTADDFATTMDYVFHQQPYIPPPVARFLAERMAADRAHLTTVFDDLRYRSPALETLVGADTAPSLIVWGSEDRVLHPEGASILAGQMPDSTVDLMPDTGHLPMIERPRRVADRYLDWRQTLE